MELRRHLAVLEKVEADLEDGRRYLVEQYDRLAQAQRGWQEGRAASAADLEALGYQLQERERGLVDGEQRLHGESEEVAAAYKELESQKARLVVDRARWQ